MRGEGWEEKGFGMRDMLRMAMIMIGGSGGKKCNDEEDDDDDDDNKDASGEGTNNHCNGDDHMSSGGHIFQAHNFCFRSHISETRR